MKISVLMCVYGGDNSNYFVEAYDSVLEQTLLPSQVVLVVDGPVGEQMKSCIKAFEDIAIKKSIQFDIVWIDKNMGHGYARMQGLLQCIYESVAIADADDINNKERFEKQNNYLENCPDISIVGAQILEVNHADLSPISMKIVPEEHDEIVKYMKFRCPFNQMTVMFRKSSVLKAGNYMDFHHNEDYYLWIRMYLNDFKFHNLPESLVQARVNPDFYGRRGGIKYFLSELKIQTIMLRKKIINPFVYINNVLVRFLVQVVMPNSIRAFVFAKVFRSNA